MSSKRNDMITECPTCGSTNIQGLMLAWVLEARPESLNPHTHRVIPDSATIVHCGEDYCGAEHALRFGSTHIRDTPIGESVDATIERIAYTYQSDIEQSTLSRLSELGRMIDNHNKSTRRTADSQA